MNAMKRAAAWRRGVPVGIAAPLTVAVVRIAFM